VEEFADDYVQYDGIECRTINNEEYPDICPNVFKVIQSLVDGSGNCILCRPVGPVSGGGQKWEEGFNVPQY